MGYTSTFDGDFTVTPPLNDSEISYLKDFAATRRMDREEGPYYAKDDGQFGQSQTPGIRNYNNPPEGQPGLWCQWVPGPAWAGIEASASQGDYIAWDGGEKFYNAWEWLVYLINHFLMPGAEASKDLVASVKQDPRLADFTFNHVLNGEVFVQGEDSDDRWKIVVSDNVVKTAHAVITYPDPT